MKRDEALDELASILSSAKSEWYYGKGPEKYFREKMQEVLPAIGCTPEEIEKMDL